MPAANLITFEGCSPRSLIYDDRDIQHAVLVYSEMDSIVAGNGEEDTASTALSYLRTLVTNGIATYDVVVRGKDGFRNSHHIKEGPATLIVTGTRRLPDAQLASRLHEIEVTVDKARLGAVIGAQSSMLQGGTVRPPLPSIVAAQAYLQSLAPLDAVIPFAGTLGRAILAAAKVSDPRLTREFPRVCGFTAAHALLCVRRRERDKDGAVIATLEDYEAARGVIRELSTIREFSKFAIEVWNEVNDIHKNTGKAVTVAEVSKAMLKAQRYVRNNLNLLVAGGALLDVRDRPSKTSPILVTPTGESPSRVLLPTSDELTGAIPPPESTSERGQSDMAQSINSDILVPHSAILVDPMNGKDLTPLGGSGARGDKPDPDPDIYVHKGIGYRQGDVLPDGRRVLDTVGPILSKRPTPTNPQRQHERPRGPRSCHGDRREPDPRRRRPAHHRGGRRERHGYPWRCERASRSIVTSSAPCSSCAWFTRAWATRRRTCSSSRGPCCLARCPRSASPPARRSG